MNSTGGRKDGRRQCTARSKRSGGRCKGLACRGRAVCRMHGGKALGAPLTADGLYSRYALCRFVALFHLAREAFGEGWEPDHVGHAILLALAHEHRPGCRATRKVNGELR